MPFHFIFIAVSLLWTPAFAADPALPPEALEHAVRDNRLKVAELAQVAQVAKRHGLRVFLFGGTAATLTHYVKDATLKARGEPGYGNARDDYHLTTMFPGTEDLDLVVTREDGAPESEKEIAAFAAEVQRRVRPHRARAAAWEVRGLKTSFNGKSPLLGGFDFQNQSTDSASTGLVELTETAGPVVTDVRGASFLTDAASGEIHYLRSSKHPGTTKAMSGDNPEILSAIRCLSKALQFGLTLDEESEREIHEVISAFDPTGHYTSYARARIESEARKLVTLTRDVSRTQEIVEQFHLKEKLAPFAKSPRHAGSLAALFEKAVLPRRLSFHEASAPTARELGITRVAHGTTDFDAFLSITASPDGSPNAYVSRSNSL